MSCDCETYTCLDAFYNPCSEGVALDVAATDSLVWSGRIEYNGIWTLFSFGVTEGEDIVIPTEFLNEYYDHQFKLYDNAGELFGCYKLKSRAMGNAGTYAPVAPVDLQTFDLEMDSVTSTVTDARLLNKTLVLISLSGQSYNSAFWSKPLASATLTSTLLTFNPGDIITFIYR
jgi:hypothetical protein